jgi:hypothetical protein
MAAWLSDVPDDHASGAGSFAVMASPSDHNSAPSRTTSFSKNCPTAPERAGNPPRLGSQPGVENKNESVVRNIRTATVLPIVHALADQCRRQIKIAIHNSTMPNAVANCRTVRMSYCQPINGLCATRGCIPLASYSVNFISPIQAMTVPNHREYQHYRCLNSAPNFD